MRNSYGALRPIRLRPTALAAICLLLAGCRASKTEPTQTQAAQEAGADAASAQGIKLKLRLDAAQQRAAEQLVSKINNGQFPPDVVRDPANAPLLLYLAATQQDESVVVAAVRGMRMAYTPRTGPEKRPSPDADYGAVVAAHLASNSSELQGAAIEAATLAVRGAQPSRPVIDELVRIATTHQHPGARADATAYLQLVKGFAKDPEIAAALLKALDDKETYVVSRALEGLRTWAAYLPNKDPFLAKARKLLFHKNPGVRGRAAELVGRLGEDKPQLATELWPLLEEKHPFVRSCAALGLAHLGHLPAAHCISKLLSEDDENTYLFCCYTSLAGRRTRVTHRGSTWPQVRDAAVSALARLSTRTEHRFIPGQVDRKDLDASLAKNAREAKAWYLKVKAKLPKE